MSRRDDMDAPLRFPNEETRQTIGAFARVVGLSASALRQYGDSGLLVPARIEERTGYRYYSPDQQQRAIWIRRLRDAGLGLSRVRTILDGDVDEAEALLDEWLSDAAAARIACHPGLVCRHRRASRRGRDLRTRPWRGA